MNMMVSGIVGEGEDKHVCIMFSDEDRSAEAMVPECRIVKNSGFSDDEVRQLEVYLKENEELILDRAKGINPIKAMMKE